MANGFQTTIASLVFLVALLLTFGAAVVARLRRQESGEEELAGRRLNKWLIGLSAATTGNSGFIVTGAVGLGYVGGLHFLLLPLSWLLGDLLFWSLFPHRINQWARESGATTLPELISAGLKGPWVKAIRILVGLVIVIFLSGYASGQWLAGTKMLTGLAVVSKNQGLWILALLVISYSCIGGFRGAVYTDFVQSFIRILGTGVACVWVIYTAFQTPDFMTQWQSAGPAFLSLLNGDVGTTIGFVAGFAAASIGFGLGQPQIISRYMAGSSPEETRAARWIYISFLQGTWIAMTLFGVMLRGVMPGLEDPETGLIVFFAKKAGPVLTGLIAADFFATIASTANGLLVAIAQSVRNDLLTFLPKRFLSRPESLTIGIGLGTIFMSLYLPNQVASVIITTASFLGAGLGGAVVIRVMKWPCSAFSLFMGMGGATLLSVGWFMAGYSDLLNVSFVGIVTALVVNEAVRRVQ